MQLEFSFKEIVSAFMVLFAIIDITGSIPVILDIKSKGGKVQALPAAIGSFVGPGFGTVIGGVLGILVGAASGAAAGNAVGKLLDENVFRQYRCGKCGYTWRAA